MNLFQVPKSLLLTVMLSGLTSPKHCPSGHRAGDPAWPRSSDTGQVSFASCPGVLCPVPVIPVLAFAAQNSHIHNLPRLQESSICSSK